MTRDEILSRYRHFRTISRHHNDEALSYLSRQAVLDQAKRLGLAHRTTLVADSEEEMTLVFDLALHTAPPGRSRALDRYARAAQLPPGSDEALALDAMRQSRFSIWKVKELHETAGLIVTDVMRDEQAWLVDENLEAAAKRNMGFALRLCELGGFMMNCGASVPLNYDIIQEALLNTVPWREKASAQQQVQDPRFATAVYRAAVDSGLFEMVT